jgi:hypothetical protein
MPRPSPWSRSQSSNVASKRLVTLSARVCILDWTRPHMLLNALTHTHTRSLTYSCAHTIYMLQPLSISRNVYLGIFIQGHKTVVPILCMYHSHGVYVYMYTICTFMYVSIYIMFVFVIKMAFIKTFRKNATTGSESVWEMTVLMTNWPY